MRKSRQAFTLMEVVLVLALLVVIAALTFPSIEVMYTDMRMTSAADQIQAHWAEARARAMEDGQPYTFSVVWSKGNYRIAPENADSSSATSDASGPNNTPDAGLLVIDDRLEKGIRFGQPDAWQGSAGDGQGDSSMPVDGVDASSWSSVVTFLPDGTARADATLILYARNATPLSVKVRALTGAVTVTPVQQDGDKP